MKLTNEEILTLIERQLQQWPEARRNFDLLAKAQRKILTDDSASFQIATQCNPARIRSTAAAVDKESIAARRCFLCRENRPPEQLCGEILDGWEFCVNPYPILPIHFTIIATEHTPQAEIPLEMAAMAESAPDLVFFFNGARAGASAPDHMHTQAVLKCELPLIKTTEKFHSVEHGGWMSSEEFDTPTPLPFQYLSAVITPDLEGMKALAKTPNIYGVDSATGQPDRDLVNAFFWIDTRGYLRIVVIPRSAHRPPHYFFDKEEQIMCSPGALDMAGILVLPRQEDFDRVDLKLANEIYASTGLQKIPDALIEYLKR